MCIRDRLNSRPHKGTPYGKGGGIIKGYRPEHGGNSQWGGLREPEQIHRPIPKGLRTAAYRIPQAYQKIKKVARSHFLACRKTHGVVKGPQPLKFIPALTTCASKRMKTQRFSYFAGFAARERMREAKPEKDSLKWLKATLAKCLLSDIFAAHVLYQHIGYLHGAVWLLVILQYGGYGAAYRNA